MDKTRGFSELVGETIVSIDATAINVAVITTASGKQIHIDGENHHYGIPIIQAVLQPTNS